MLWSYKLTRNTRMQQPLARFPNLFSVMQRLHTATNRANFVSWGMSFNGSHTEVQRHFLTRTNH